MTPPSGVAMRLSTVMVIGAFVAEPDRYDHSPTPPATCNPAVESDDSNCQPAGSVPLASHTFAFRFVGAVPITWNRTFNTSPAPRDTPGTDATVWITDSDPFTMRTS